MPRQSKKAIRNEIRSFSELLGVEIPNGIDQMGWKELDAIRDNLEEKMNEDITAAGDAGDVSGDASGDVSGDVSGDAGDVSGDAGDVSGDAGDVSGDAGEFFTVTDKVNSISFRNVAIKVPGDKIPAKRLTEEEIEMCTKKGFIK